jgi:hypothetical protein
LGAIFFKERVKVIIVIFRAELGVRAKTICLVLEISSGLSIISCSLSMRKSTVLTNIAKLINGSVEDIDIYDL